MSINMEATMEPSVSNEGINELWLAWVSKLSDRIRALVRDDDDLYQECILGIRKALLNNPDAGDGYFINAARWAAIDYIRRGVSVDNGGKREYSRELADGTIRKYRKEMKPIYMDKLNREFRLEFPDYSYPPEVLALDRICAGRFYSLLSQDEAEFVDASIDCLDSRHHESATMRQMGIDQPRYNRLRMSTRRKFIRGFGTDEEIEMLDQHEAMEDMYE